jgi:hypothetical protein
VTDPDSVRWILVDTDWHDGSWNETLDYIRNNPNAPEWSSWYFYDAPNDSGKFWTTPPLDFGQYVFAVHGKTIDGVVGEEFDFIRNARRLLVSPRTTGPLLRVTGDLIDPIVTSTVETPPTVIDIASGTPVMFCWTADASAYGGIVMGYRYGWDIVDLEDDSAWEIPFTPFDEPEECSPIRTFFFGTHTFHVEVIDNNGFPSRVPIIINIIPGPVMGLLDIRPGACPNPFNPKSNGVLTAAVLGTPDFDVSDIDVSTISMEGAASIRAKIKDVSAFVVSGDECGCPGNTPDGLDDMVLTFRMQEVVAGLQPGSGYELTKKSDQSILAGSRRPLGHGNRLTLAVSGSLTNGTTFEVGDCVTVVGHQHDAPCLEAQWLFDGTGDDETGRHNCTVYGGATFVPTPGGSGLLTALDYQYAQYDPPIDEMKTGQIAFRFKLDGEFGPGFGAGPIVFINSERDGLVDGDFSIHLESTDGRIWFLQDNAMPMWMLRTNKDTWQAGVWYDVTVSWGASGRQIHVMWDGGSEAVSDGAVSPCFSPEAVVRTIGARDPNALAVPLTLESMEIRCETKGGGPTPKMEMIPE